MHKNKQEQKEQEKQAAKNRKKRDKQKKNDRLQISVTKTNKVYLRKKDFCKNTFEFRKNLWQKSKEHRKQNDSASIKVQLFSLY